MSDSVVVTAGELVNAIVGAVNDGVANLPLLSKPDLSPTEWLALTDTVMSSTGALAAIATAFTDAAPTSGVGLVGIATNAYTASSGMAKMLDAVLTHNSNEFIGGFFDVLSGSAGLLSLYPPYRPLMVPVAAAAAIAKRYLEDNPDALGQALDLFKKSFNEFSESISDTVSDLWQHATAWIMPRDPLVLDLDGDGIEATAIDPRYPVLFDHDADGIKTATGWVKSDDGILVLDRDGNGSVDTGRELFGDNTILENGANAGQRAANGFEALADLDGNGDHQIDANDAMYSGLRIWQDLNQDGSSQADELFILAEKGIVSISLSATATSTNLGNGNTQPWTGTYTKADGTTGESGTPELSGSLVLAANNFYREFTDDPELTDAAWTLPQMHGSGLVRDLREAMSLGTADAESLVDSVAAFAAATTRDEQMALTDNLLTIWGSTSDRQVDSIYRYNLVLNGDGHYVTTNYTGEGFGSIVLTLHPQGMETTTYDSLFGTRTVPTEAGAEVLRRLNVLEVFNGSKFVQLIPPSSSSSPWVGASGGSGISGGSGTVAGATYVDVTLSAAQIDLLNAGYDELRDSVYDALVVQTRLRPYLDQIALVVDEQGARFDTTSVVAMLDARKSIDERNAFIDLVELNKYARDTLMSTGFPTTTVLRGWTDSVAPDAPVRAEFTSLGLYLGAASAGSESVDVYLGDADANSFTAGGGDDVLESARGNDTLSGGAGSDVIDGGAGNDVLIGGSFSAYWNTYTGAGADIYLFGRGDGQDTVYDNDATAGVADAIVFKAGVLPSEIEVQRPGGGTDLVLRITGTTDQITVRNYFAGDGSGGWAVEEIRFTDAAETVWSVADVKSMMLVGSAGADTILGYASDDVITAAGGDDIVIAGAGDDTVDGGDGADALRGDHGRDVLLGGAGDDNLQGGNGDDVIDGGTGNDVLNGGTYDGYWNTYAGPGADTYAFGRGDGQDTVYDNDTSAGVIDSIVFKAGVSPADVQVVRSSNADLILKIAGSTDQITVKNYFTGDAAGGWAVEEIRFAGDPSTVWTLSTIKTLAITGTAAADYLAGYAGDDTISASAGDDSVMGNGGADSLNGEDGADSISAGAGDDTLAGGAGADSLYGDDGNDGLYGGSDNDNLQGGSGNDVLDGGTGNDLLNGGSYDGYWNTYTGSGADTYLFGRGDGQDTVYDNDNSAGVVDKIVFKAGVLPVDVQAVRPASSNDLVLKINGSTDQITVANYFANDGAGGWTIEEIRFTDNAAAVWTVADVKNKVALSGTTGNDNLVGYATADVMWGGAGNDTLSGRAGNDTLNGEAGADTLYGEDGNDSLSGGADNDYLQGANGNDTLDGGSGNDTLIGGSYDGYWNTYGGAGADTYLFGRGDGQDVVYDNDASAGVIDKLVFKSGVLPSDVQVVRPSNTDLVLKISGTSDQITVKNYFTSDAAAGWAVEEIRFADDPATVWTVAAVKAAALTGTAGADYLEGYASDDTINAGAGNDRVIGNAGADTLNGEDGADSISGGTGNDALYGGIGADTLAGNDGDDGLYGGADNDNLQGGNGNDTLDGGAGNDALIGGAYDGYWNTYTGSGADTYLFGRGDGQDTVYDADSTAGVVDTIVFKSGVLPTDLQVVRPSGSSNLVLKINGTTDQITVANYFLNDATGGWSVEEIRFFDDPGTVWTIPMVKMMAITGTTAADYLEGYATDDTISAGAGNDRVVGNAGADSLDGEDGADSISGGAGNDTLLGGAGADTLAGNDGDDGLYGGADNDNLQGGNGNDTLDGGAGNDALIGGVYDGYWNTYSGSGADSYLFGRGDGQDTVYDADSTAGVVDTIVFKSGVLPADLQVVRPSGSNNLVLKINGTTDQITVANYFLNDATDGWAIEEIRFTDDATALWTIADVKTMAITGGPGADVLVGYAGDDVMVGNAGNDTMSSGAGNDRLDGGAGADTLVGGTGNDTYLLARGYGIDTVQENDATAGNADSAAFASGIATDQLWFLKSGNYLEVSIIGTADKLVMTNWYTGNQYHVEQFRTDDGKVLLDTQVQNLVNAMAGFAPPAAGQTTLPTDYAAQLNPVIAANWQ